MFCTTNYIGALKTIGEQDDLKRCFEARDEHFNCLDEFKTLEDNHFKCPRSYEMWQQSCSRGIRRNQMDQRNLIKRDHFLYTQSQLDDYNKRKNIRDTAPAQFFSYQY